MPTHKLPQDHVIIQGKTNTIHVTDGVINTPDGAAQGLSQPDIGRITVNVSGEVSLHNLKDTVLHECLHILDHGAQIGLKEKQVHRLAVAILDFMWSNPAMAAWLGQRDWVVKDPLKKKRASKKKPPSKTPMGFMSTAPKLPPDDSSVDLPPLV